MSHSRAGADGAPSARHVLLEQLRRDHERLLRAFREFDHGDSLQACQQIVQRTCAELKVHAALEEELFYPAARRSLDEPDLIDEAQIEHRSIAMLLEYVEQLPPDDAKYKASFRVLGDYVEHHVRDEEHELFVQLLDASLDWEALARAVAARRVALCDEFGLACDDEPAAARSQAADAGIAR